MYVHQDNMNSFHFISYSYYTVGIFAQANGRGEALLYLHLWYKLKPFKWSLVHYIIGWVLEHNGCES